MEGRLKGASHRGARNQEDKRVPVLLDLFTRPTLDTGRGEGENENRTKKGRPEVVLVMSESPSHLSGGEGGGELGQHSLRGVLASELSPPRARNADHTGKKERS